jgi:hypothetical protein
MAIEDLVNINTSPRLVTQQTPSFVVKWEGLEAEW